MNSTQLFQLQKLASQGRLKPEDQQQLQQHIFQLKKLHQMQQMRQRAAHPQNVGPHQPAQQPPRPPAPPQAPVARPQPQQPPPQQPQHTQQQLGSGDSPSALKKLKRERDQNEDDLVVIDQKQAMQQPQRPGSDGLQGQQPTGLPQFSSRAQLQAQKPNVPQQAPPALQGNTAQAAQAASEATAAKQAVTEKEQQQGREEQLRMQINRLMKLLEEEKSSHESRSPLQLDTNERVLLRQQLGDESTKNMIRRTDQLLPIFIMLGGTDKLTRELVRTVTNTFVLTILTLLICS